MAVTNLQLAQVAALPTFQQRVAVVMAAYAATVYAEAGTVPSHGARANFAIRVAQGNYNLAAAANAVINNATIAAEVTPGTDTTIQDADILTAVTSLWNMFAGI